MSHLFVIQGTGDKTKKVKEERAKRKRELWLSYFDRLLKSHEDDNLVKCAYAGVRCFEDSFHGEEVGKYFLNPSEWDDPYKVTSTAFVVHRSIIQLLSALSPAQIVQLFPQAKEYKGNKYGSKDWYSSVAAVNKFGGEKMLGEDIPKTYLFLTEQNNRFLNEFVIAGWLIMDDLRRQEGQKTMLEEFYEEKMGKPLQTYWVKDGAHGKILTNEAGEKIGDISAPKPRWARKATEKK